MIRAFFCVLIFTTPVLGIAAQDSDCAEITFVAKAARAKSPGSLAQITRMTGDSYRAQLVSAYRAFQLSPSSKASARRLLALIPKDDDHQTVILTLGDSLCAGESTSDMEALSRVGADLSRAFTTAVLLAPEFMVQYLKYSFVSAQDPHSDFAVQMKRVCRQSHRAFMRAVNELPADEKRSFAKYVVVPDTCRVIAVPEAE